MVTTRRLQLVLTLSVAMAAIGCKDDPNLNFIADLSVAKPADLAGADLTGVALDMTVVPDQAVAPDLIGADLTFEPDLSTPEDMTALPDLIEPDLVVDPTADMVVLPDMVIVPDMVEVADMLVLPDMVIVPDMIVLSDMVPGFGVSSAVATSATTVEVTFNDTVKDASVAPSDFTISGLNVTGASVSGNKVTLTTDPQSEAANYLVEVTGEILDGTDRPISAGTSAAFTGFVPPAPSITSFTPTSVVRGVTGLTITGTALKPGGGTPTVTIGGVAQVVATSTDTTIVITTVDPTTPTGPAQPVFVATADGTDTENIEVLGDFRMESANVLTPTTLAVTFNRAADAGTVSAARFSVAGLTVDSAVAAGALVTLTFSTPLVDATSYALYVTTDLKDTFGASAVATHIVNFQGAAPTEFVLTVTGNGTLTGSVMFPVALERRSIATPAAGANATISLPSAAPATVFQTVAAPNALEGVVTRSPDGKSLAIAGYRVAAGTASGSLGSVVRGAAVIKASDFATPNFTTILATEFGTFGNVSPRSAIVNGSDLWIASNLSGLFHAEVGKTDAATVVSGSPTNGRVVGIFGGQLYYTNVNTVNTAVGINQVGTGLPTTTATATNIDTAFVSGAPTCFNLFDVSDEPGFDLAYVCDDATTGSTTPGLRRFKKSSTGWAEEARWATPVAQGTCYLQGNDAVCLVASGLSFFKFTDTNRSTASAASLGTSAFNSATNFRFRGVAIAPQP